MRSLLALISIAVGTASLPADDQTDWKEFTSKEGHFKVVMPGTPKEERFDTESDFGKGVLHMNSVQADKTFYAANYCDFPAEIKKAAIKKVYDSSRNGAVANLEGKLVSEKEIKLGKYPGREIQIEVAGGQRLFRARVFLVEQRLYQVVVMGSKETVRSKATDKFLESFKLDKK